MSLPRQDSIDLAATQFTPAIRWNPVVGLVEITGNSYPDNVEVFYKPVVKAFETIYCQGDEALTVRFQLTYFNTSSIRYLDLILDCLERRHQQSGLVRVIWCYEQEDPDLEEAGREILERFTFSKEFKAV